MLLVEIDNLEKKIFSHQLYELSRHFDEGVDMYEARQKRSLATNNFSSS